MNNTNENNNKILNISFNQDNSCFSVSTEKGFKIYETFPFQREYEKNIGGGLRITEMYYHSNILALVSGGESPKFSQRKLIIWDDSLNKEIKEINFFQNIKNVKMKKENIYIICEDNIYIFNLKTLENIEIINTLENHKGIFSINSDEKNDVIAYLGIKNDLDNNKKGIDIIIKNYENSLTSIINYKEDVVSYICLNSSGNLLAVANEKGNEIKIYNCLNGDLMGDLHRGNEKAEINYICFDKSTNYLAVTSDRGTIHIWSMKTFLQKLIDFNKNNINKENFDKKEENGENDKINNEINELPINKKLMFSQSEISFGKIRINTKKSICSFQENNIIVVVTYEGIYYQAKFDNKLSGDCQIIEQKDLKI